MCEECGPSDMRIAAEVSRFCEVTRMRAHSVFLVFWRKWENHTLAGALGDAGWKVTQPSTSWAAATGTRERCFLKAFQTDLSSCLLVVMLRACRTKERWISLTTPRLWPQQTHRPSGIAWVSSRETYFPQLLIPMFSHSIGNKLYFQKMQNRNSCFFSSTRYGSMLFMQTVTKVEFKSSFSDYF